MSWKLNLLSDILGCSQWDIDYLFSTLADSEMLYEAIKCCRNNNIPLCAETLWLSVIEIAYNKCFESGTPDIQFNFMDSHIFLAINDYKKLHDFRASANSFYELTGFEIEIIEN